jgi:putative hydrolase of the HAD superfamily
MTDLEPPKLAIFDLGNVVFRVDWEPMFNTWSQASGTPIARLRDSFRFDQNFEAFERGNLSPEEFHRRLCRTLGSEFSYSDFVTGWNAIYQDVFEGIELTLQQLKYKIQVVAFTNTNETHCLVWPERYREVLSHFQSIFISSEIGIRKPEAEGFGLVLDRCGVSPGEVIFFDDFVPNIEAAASLGIRAILVDSSDVVKKSLIELGLITETR